MRGAWNRTRSGRRPIESCIEYAEAAFQVVNAALSDDSPSPRETLMQMIDGYRLSQALHVAATLSIADFLADGPRSVANLAEATGTDQSALYRLLRTLASVGVFVETDDGFCLTPLAMYLRSGVPGSVRAWAMHIGQQYFWQTWGHLLDSVRMGEPAFQTLFGMNPWEYREAHPKANAIFNQAMTDLAAGVVNAVVESYDFSGIEVLVDVGGGEGALLAAILTAYPTLHGILFDQPHVVTDAWAVFERAGVAARCEVAQGSFFDAVPGGADAYLMKSIIHDWDDASAIRILLACRTAIADTGKLLLVERVIQPGNDPDPAKFLDLNMLVMLGGRERTADDFRALYTQSGFHLTRIVPTASGFSVIEGTPDQALSS